MAAEYLHESVWVERAGFRQPAHFLDHRRRRAAPDHQHPGFRGARVSETVHDASRRERKTPGLQPLAPVTEDELHRALDDEPGLVIAVVHVRGCTRRPRRGAAFENRKSADPDSALTAP